MTAIGGVDDTTFVMGILGRTRVRWGMETRGVHWCGCGRKSAVKHANGSIAFRQRRVNAVAGNNRLGDFGASECSTQPREKKKQRHRLFLDTLQR
jgi:hypothetical protein